MRVRTDSRFAARKYNAGDKLNWRGRNVGIHESEEGGIRRMRNVCARETEKTVRRKRDSRLMWKAKDGNMEKTTWISLVWTRTELEGRDNEGHNREQ